MSLESVVQRKSWLMLGRICTMFRLNSGKAWLSGAGPVQRLQDGSVVVPAARPVALGLALTNGDPVVGQSDLLGWHSIVVTPEMVGAKVAVVTGIETKRTKGGRKGENQINFGNQLVAAGGIAGFASSAEEALQIINDWRKKMGLPEL